MITQLAEMDAIDYGLFKQAYTVSLDVSKCLHQYEMSKLLTEPYDMEGACMFIKAGYGSTYSEVLFICCFFPLSLTFSWKRSFSPENEMLLASIYEKDLLLLYEISIAAQEISKIDVYSG